MMSSRCSIVSVGVLSAVLACGHDDDDGGDASGATSPDQVGSVCEVPDDCYPDADGELQGEILCLDRVPEGYCTHECAVDEDCCAVPGECATDLAQVCSPFESADNKMCFLSCEDADVEAAGAPDEQSFCHHEVSTSFICRSSGGGSENRKVCVPGDCDIGAACGEELPCPGDLDCLDDFDGGYCGRRDCAGDGDCPDDARCVTIDDVNICVKTCGTDGDCGLCRGEDVAAACTDEVEFVEGTAEGVCVPPAS